MEHDHAHCHSEEHFRIGKPLAITGGVFALILALSFLPPLAALNESLLAYIGQIWWAVLLGLGLGGLIEYFVPEGFIFRFLGQQRLRSVFYAVIGGFIMSACSHGILAIAMQLYKKGASAPAVVTFLMASPWANLPMTVLLFGFFGWNALLFIVGAMVIAVVTGFVYMGLARLQWIEPQQIVPEQATPDWSRLRHFQPRAALRGVSLGTVSLANMVLWWILIGVTLAALLRAYLPDQLFMEYFGPDLAGLALTLVFATLIEVCSEGTSPLAFEIFNQVGALGNPFVFLMAGVATDYTEIGLIWSNIGKRAALWLPVVTVPQIMLLAWAINWFTLS